MRRGGGRVADTPIAAWLPGAIKKDPNGASKLRRVESPTDGADALSSLKKTVIGKFYIKRLKKIPLVRSGTLWMWRNFYPFYASVNSRLNSYGVRRWRPLVKQEIYSKTANLDVIKLLDGARVNTPVPRVFPAKDAAYLTSPHDHYDFPSVYVTVMEDADVYGGTNLVFTRNEVICHDLYDLERDYTSEELHGRHLIDVKGHRIRLLCHDATPERVPVAATFVDACAPNYAHWLTEVLPRIATFCSSEQFADVPIIVNDGLHPNIIESLMLVVGNNREIISLPIGRALTVGRLYVTSVAGYVPFERRNKKLENHSHGLFSPAAIDLLVRCITCQSIGVASGNWPRRIYLRRTSGARKVTNAAEIEDVLFADGYSVIEPERLAFLHQIALFSGAESIVGPSGAALTNILFSSQVVNVNILIGKYENTSYWYWQNMACAAGKTVNYTLGDITEQNQGIHSDFHIAPNDVSEFLSKDEV